MSEQLSGPVSGRSDRRYELLYSVGVALSAERNKNRLLEMILVRAKELCNADGGTLYLRTEDDHLKFAIMRTDSLALELGGTTGKEITLPPIPMWDPVTREPNQKNVASAAALSGNSVNIPDAYDAPGFDFSGTRVFDERNNYRSTSFLTIPLVNSDQRVIGVLQLLNATDPDTGKHVPFDPELQRTVEALASQAGIALSNQLLLEAQKELLESFIKMIAAAIDAKSRYTGGHCERVPILTEMLVRSLCEQHDGPFADFHLSDEEWYEMRVAAWLHDCGKVTTPVHVMDKATKLETISDRIELIRTRFELLRRDAEIDYLRKLNKGQGDPEELEKAYRVKLAQLETDLAFLENANVGGEFLEPDKQARIRALGNLTYSQCGEDRPLLDEEEIYNLSISRGTLTPEERVIINGHMVQTIRMLEALPFPETLKRVPEYAGGHHEKMDGSGYPKGIFAGEMSIPARAMAIADVFEALTAQDRPYKKGKTLSESMQIMGKMKEFNHLDPELFDHFVRSKVYLEYGKRYLPEELLDEVDESALLAIKPRGFEEPPQEVREARWRDFLPEYR